MAKVRYRLLRGKNYLIFPFDFVDEAFTKVANASKSNILKYEQLKDLALKVVRRTTWEELKPLNCKVIPLTDEEFRYLTTELDSPI